MKKDLPTFLLLVSSFAFGQGLKNKTDKKLISCQRILNRNLSKELNKENTKQKKKHLCVALISRNSGHIV